MKPQLFTNVKIFDGTGAPMFAGEALVENNLIRTVARGNGGITRESSYDVIDGKGMTLMPGLVEAHSHVTYSNMVKFDELGRIPIEEHTILALQNVKLMLESGFTSLYSAASSKFRLEVAIRNAIDAGQVPGPRMRAASSRMPARESRDALACLNGS